MFTVHVLTRDQLTRNCHAPKRSARKIGAFDKKKKKTLSVPPLAPAPAAGNHILVF
jgi:hypothetical protein